MNAIERAIKKLAKRKVLPGKKRVPWRQQKIEQEAWLRIYNLEEKRK